MKKLGVLFALLFALLLPDLALAGYYYRGNLENGNWQSKIMKDEGDGLFSYSFTLNGNGQGNWCYKFTNATSVSEGEDSGTPINSSEGNTTLSPSTASDIKNHGTKENGGNFWFSNEGFKNKATTVVYDQKNNKAYICETANWSALKTALRPGSSSGGDNLYYYLRSDVSGNWYTNLMTETQAGSGIYAVSVKQNNTNSPQFLFKSLADGNKAGSTDITGGTGFENIQSTGSNTTVNVTTAAAQTGYATSTSGSGNFKLQSGYNGRDLVFVYDKNQSKAYVYTQDEWEKVLNPVVDTKPTQLYLRGNFNDSWATSKPMIKTADGVFTVDITVNAGYFINFSTASGTGWPDDNTRFGPTKTGTDSPILSNSIVTNAAIKLNGDCWKLGKAGDYTVTVTFSDAQNAKVTITEKVTEIFAENLWYNTSASDADGDGWATSRSQMTKARANVFTKTFNVNEDTYVVFFSKGTRTEDWTNSYGIDGANVQVSNNLSKVIKYNGQSADALANTGAFMMPPGRWTATVTFTAAGQATVTWTGTASDRQGVYRTQLYCNTNDGGWNTAREVMNIAGTNSFMYTFNNTSDIEVAFFTTDRIFGVDWRNQVAPAADVTVTNTTSADVTVNPTDLNKLGVFKVPAVTDETGAWTAVVTFTSRNNATVTWSNSLTPVQVPDHYTKDLYIRVDNSEAGWNIIPAGSTTGANAGKMDKDADTKVYSYILKNMPANSYFVITPDDNSKKDGTNYWPTNRLSPAKEDGAAYKVDGSTYNIPAYMGGDCYNLVKKGDYLIQVRFTDATNALVSVTLIPSGDPADPQVWYNTSNAGDDDWTTGRTQIEASADNKFVFVTSFRFFEPTFVTFFSQDRDAVLWENKLAPAGNVTVANGVAAELASDNAGAFRVPAGAWTATVTYVDPEHASVIWTGEEAANGVFRTELWYNTQIDGWETPRRQMTSEGNDVFTHEFDFNDKTNVAFFGSDRLFDEMWIGSMVPVDANDNVINQNVYDGGSYRIKAISENPGATQGNFVVPAGKWLATVTVNDNSYATVTWTNKGDKMLYYTYSTDNGSNWSEPKAFTHVNGTTDYTVRNIVLPANARVRVLTGNNNNSGANIPSSIVFGPKNSNQSPAAGVSTEIFAANNNSFIFPATKNHYNLFVTVSDATDLKNGTFRYTVNNDWLNMPLKASDFTGGKAHYFLVGYRLGAYRLQPEWEFTKDASGKYVINKPVIHGTTHVAVAKVTSYADYIKHSYTAYGAGATVSSGTAITLSSKGTRSKISGTEETDPFGTNEINYAPSLKPSAVEQIVLEVNASGNPSKLTFNGIKTAQKDVMPYMSLVMVGENIINNIETEYDPAKTYLYGNLKQKAWTNGWVQYDPETGMPYTDADDNYLFHTNWSWEWMKNHSTKFTFTLDDNPGDENVERIEQDSRALTFRAWDAYTQQEQKDDPYLDYYKYGFQSNKKVDGVHNGTAVNDGNISWNFTGKPDGTEVTNPEYKAYVIKDVWLSGQFKIFTGFGGTRTGSAFDWNQSWHFGPNTNGLMITGKEIENETAEDFNFYQTPETEDKNYNFGATPIYAKRIILWVPQNSDISKSYLQVILQDYAPIITARVTSSNGKKYLAYDWDLPTTGLAVNDREITSIKVERLKTDGTNEFVSYARLANQGTLDGTQVLNGLKLENIDDIEDTYSGLDRNADEEGKYKYRITLEITYTDPETGVQKTKKVSAESNEVGFYNAATGLKVNLYQVFVDGKPTRTLRADITKNTALKNRTVTLKDGSEAPVENYIKGVRLYTTHKPTARVLSGRVLDDDEEFDANGKFVFEDFDTAESEGIEKIFPLDGDKALSIVGLYAVPTEVEATTVVANGLIGTYELSAEIVWDKDKIDAETDASMEGSFEFENDTDQSELVLGRPTATFKPVAVERVLAKDHVLGVTEDGGESFFFDPRLVERSDIKMSKVPVNNTGRPEDTFYVPHFNFFTRDTDDAINMHVDYKGGGYIHTEAYDADGNLLTDHYDIHSIHPGSMAFTNYRDADGARHAGGLTEYHPVYYDRMNMMYAEADIYKGYVDDPNYTAKYAYDAPEISKELTQIEGKTVFVSETRPYSFGVHFDLDADEYDSSTVTAGDNTVLYHADAHVDNPDEHPFRLTELHMPTSVIDAIAAADLDRYHSGKRNQFIGIMPVMVMQTGETQADGTRATEEVRFLRRQAELDFSNVAEMLMDSPTVEFDESADSNILFGNNGTGEITYAAAIKVHVKNELNPAGNLDKLVGFPEFFARGGEYEAPTYNLVPVYSETNNRISYKRSDTGEAVSDDDALAYFEKHNYLNWHGYLASEDDWYASGENLFKAANGGYKRYYNHDPNNKRIQDVLVDNYNPAVHNWAKIFREQGADGGVYVIIGNVAKAPKGEKVSKVKANITIRAKYPFLNQRKLFSFDGKDVGPAKAPRRAPDSDLVGDYTTESVNSPNVNTYSDEIPVSDNVQTGVEEVIAEVAVKHVTVFPNPANSVVTVRGAEVLGNIEIYSMSGACMYRGSADDNSATLNVETLPDGVYIVKTDAGSTRLIVKK
ncbi:MAG: T9SS type A sorting domain-containing protein [Muribaculaceae bacterium]|nr:T9SS type A sorting domain-containing protein [Muribaculaceae bacterium]